MSSVNKTNTIVDMAVAAAEDLQRLLNGTDKLDINPPEQ